MYIPKRYGQSKINNCPFCNRQATTKNCQGIPVCLQHKNTDMPDLKCLCGEYLDVMSGKYGPYFRCIRCGNMNFNKGLEINPDYKKKLEEISSSTQTEPKKQIKTKPQYKAKKTENEITITSDELDFY